MSLQCTLNSILACLETQKSNEGELLEKLCQIEEGLNGPCPIELVAMTATSATLVGDQTVNLAAGDLVDVKDAAGVVLGTATISAVKYDATADTTTATLSATTVLAADLTAAATMTKSRTALTTKTATKG